MKHESPAGNGTLAEEHDRGQDNSPSVRALVQLTGDGAVTRCDSALCVRGESIMTGPQPTAPKPRRLKVTRASDIKMKATRWLWQEDQQGKWLPLGGLVLLAGRESIG